MVSGPAAVRDYVIRGGTEGKRRLDLDGRSGPQLLAEVGIDDRVLNVAVAEPVLHEADVDAGVEQVGGDGMLEDVEVQSQGVGLLLLGAGRYPKADGPGLRWVLEPLNVLHNLYQDRGVLLLGAGGSFLGFFHLFDPAGEVFVAGQQFAHPDERANNDDVHQHGAVAVEHG